MVNKRSDGKCCGNCIVTSEPDFGGACPYAGEIHSDYYCNHWKPNMKMTKLTRKKTQNKPKPKRKICSCKK